MPTSDILAAEPWLLEALAGLPEEGDRGFELQLTRIATSGDRGSLVAQLRSIMESDEDRPLRYAAFYCLNIVLRHNKDVSLLQDLINQHSAGFKTHPTFNHLEVLFNMEKGLGNR